MKVTGHGQHAALPHVTSALTSAGHGLPRSVCGAPPDVLKAAWMWIKVSVRYLVLMLLLHDGSRNLSTLLCFPASKGLQPH